MRSFVLTEDAAREIVKAGTPKKYRSTQIVRKPTLVETPQKPEEVLELKVAETEVIAKLGKPETIQAVKAFSNPQKQKFLTGVSIESASVVVGVKLKVDDNASSDGIAFVAGIECVDGQIVVTTKYLRLEVTTQTVYPVAMTSSHPTAEALTSLGTPTTASVVAGYPNAEKASVVSSVGILN